MTEARDESYHTLDSPIAFLYRKKCGCREGRQRKSMNFILRCLTSNDLNVADQLRAALGWNQTIAD